MSLAYNAGSAAQQAQSDPTLLQLRDAWTSLGNRGGEDVLRAQRAYYEYTADHYPIFASDHGMVRWLIDQGFAQAESAASAAFAARNTPQLVQASYQREIDRGKTELAALMAPYYQGGTSSYTLPEVAIETVRDVPTEEVRSAIAFLPHEKRILRLTTEGEDMPGGQLGSGRPQRPSGNLPGMGGGGGGFGGLASGAASVLGKFGVPGGALLSSAINLFHKRKGGGGTPERTILEAAKDARPGGDPWFGDTNIWGKNYGPGELMEGVNARTVTRKTHTCPPGYVLAKNGKCYMKNLLPRAARKWTPEAKPVVSRSDQKAIRRADGARKRLVKITKQSGAFASLHKPHAAAKPRGKK